MVKGEMRGFRNWVGMYESKGSCINRYIVLAGGVVYSGLLCLGVYNGMEWINYKWMEWNEYK